MRRCVGLVAVVMVLGAVAGCGDGKPAESAKAYVERVKEECKGGDPGFDQFMTAHPSPTAGDYAAFLSTPRDVVKSFADCLSRSKPPKAVHSDIDRIAKDLRVAQGELSDALQAAKDGSKEKTEAFITKMREQMDAVEKELAAVIAAAGK